MSVSEIRMKQMEAQVCLLETCSDVTAMKKCLTNILMSPQSSTDVDDESLRGKHLWNQRDLQNV